MTTEQKIFVTMFILGDSATYKEISDYTKLTIDNIKSSLEKIKILAAPLGIDIIGINEKEDKTSGEGVHLMTVMDAKEIVTAIKKKEVDGDLTPAALQVMTVIGYMPGCTRSDVSYIRGAQSSASIRNLITRGLVYRKGEECWITNEALSHLGVSHNSELPEYERLNREFTEKLKESLSYE